MAGMNTNMANNIRKIDNTYQLFLHIYQNAHGNSEKLLKSAQFPGAEQLECHSSFTPLQINIIF